MIETKFKNPWWVAGESTVGLIVGNGAIVLFTFGILLVPIMMEFGWPRGGAGTAMFVSHVTAALATPFVGMRGTCSRRHSSSWRQRFFGVLDPTLFRRRIARPPLQALKPRPDGA